MRDPELMIGLLREMAEDPYGQVMFRKFLGMSDEAQHRLHQGELLADEGLAEWRSESMLRITNRGYEFLAAIGQDNAYQAKFAEWLDRGASVASAAAKIIELAGKAVGM